MRSKLIAIADEIPAALKWIGLLWFAFVAVAYLTPASMWFDVRYVRVPDAKANEPIKMLVAREIKRPFQGTWTVAVRQLLDNGSLYTVCHASGASHYNVRAALPDSVDLQWWTRGECKTLQPGKYLIETAWQMQLPILPDKHIDISSNIFEVRP